MKLREWMIAVSLRVCINTNFVLLVFVLVDCCNHGCLWLLFVLRLAYSTCGSSTATLSETVCASWGS
jgi:hypothetical protein